MKTNAIRPQNVQNDNRYKCKMAILDYLSRLLWGQCQANEGLDNNV